jgi:hypothetical protein
MPGISKLNTEIVIMILNLLSEFPFDFDISHTVRCKLVRKIVLEDFLVC